MIRIILGTKAQLIKMAPVILELQRRQLPHDLILTGQHHETMQDLLDGFAIPPPDLELIPRMEANTHLKMLRWLGLLLWRSGYSMKKRLWQPKPRIVLVHGDTLSTLAGAIMAKAAGVPVAHVEAGLRSFNLLHPFPEELTRILVSHLAEVFYCPGSWAANHLVPRKDRTIIDTHHNTLLDTLRFALRAHNQTPQPDPLPQPYGVVSIHRFENLSNPRRFQWIMETIERVSHPIRLRFVLHPATRAKLQSTAWHNRLQATPGITLMERTDYITFIQLLARSRFLMTDGGSNQEEAAYLGLPCLLLRQATERQEGLGKNVILANDDDQIVDTFVASNVDREWHRLPLPPNEPSRIIVDHLATFLSAIPSPRLPPP
ncbi:MAG: UDP-N-acetylglucosamine 2-epimerase (non-hydrolyzing) [Magnetococcales bacterium]|nr:UDP-N-acetylglucosamine 2-epimerase (non-hydrolyzing) [Magnetococcales bacterium]MBF0151683.1 UDP-N-acetylglucosamine 2-epimerase (non-hydrolyzing) [Magnetococcales bacterium]